MKKSYRTGYTPDDIAKAYAAVKDRGLPIRSAAIMFGVPPQTLRDRFTGVVDPDSLPGADPLLSKDEETVLVEHVEVMAQMGYGYTHIQLQHLAGELAYSLERRPTSKPLSNNWLYGFLRRWNDRLSSLNPRSLETTRAKGSTPEAISNYYSELESVLLKYGLNDKPQLIYNLDETGLQPEHRPPNVIAPPESKPQAITSPRSTTVTLIGCANAIGNSLPPYFVFKGKRFMPELLKGASTGAKAVMSDSGWSNSTIFRQYLEDHFLPHVRPDIQSSEHILLLYDGHASHVSPHLIQWAKSNNIILFVLPPHTSHLLQPLDVGIFGPFKSYYHSECSLFMRNHMGQKITRYEMSEIACKAYLKAMTPSNIQSSFRKTGIHPFCRQVISDENLFPAEAFREKEPVKKVMAIKGGKEEVHKFLEMKIEKMCTHQNEDDKISENKEKVATKRPSPGGLAITEGDFEARLNDYEGKKTVPAKKVNKCSTDSETVKVSKLKQKKKSQPKCHSPQPSTSGMQVLQTKDHSELDSDSEDTPDEGKCCQCKCFTPPKLRELPYLVILKWAQCDKCSHWVHLEFCSEVKFVRRHGEFLCPHCTISK